MTQETQAPEMQRRLVKRPSIISGDKAARYVLWGSTCLEHLSAATASPQSSVTSGQTT